MSDALKPKLSVFIIAVNEADRIGAAIQSVMPLADEVLVIDSGSTDETVRVAQAAGARVIYNPWPGYGMQKRFGEDQCRNDWLLNIDADEEITPLLRNEISNIMNSRSQHQGYFLDVREILPGEQKPGAFAHKVTCIRLYNRQYGRFSDSSVHDTVRMTSGSTGKLAHYMPHRSIRSFEHSVYKINRYSTMQAENMISCNKSHACLRLRLWLEFPFAFFKAYILRLYILKGTAGFCQAMTYAFSRFIRLAKFWEIHRLRRRT